MVAVSVEQEKKRGNALTMIFNGSFWVGADGIGSIWLGQNMGTFMQSLCRHAFKGLDPESFNRRRVQ